MLFRGAKSHPQTSGKKQVISFDSCRRITNEIIIQTELPAEPSADRSREDTIERKPIAAGPTEIRKISESFAEGRAAAEFRVELLSDKRLRISLGDGSKGKSRRRRHRVRQSVRLEKFLVVTCPAKDVELSVLCLYEVVSDTTVTGRQ